MKRIKSSFILAAGLLTVSILSSPAVFAEREAQLTDDRREATTIVAQTTRATAEETRQKVEEKRAALQQKITELQATRSEKLSEARKKVCEKREATVNGILSRRSEQGSKQKEVFDKIYDRIVTLVDGKDLTVENYDSLVATIDEKQAAVEAAIAANTETEFSCETVDGENPGKLAQNNATAIKDALQQYRTAIKDLIVAVKPGLQKTEEAQ